MYYCFTISLLGFFFTSCTFHSFPSTHDPDSILIDSGDPTTAHLYDVYGRYLATGQFIDSCLDKSITDQSNAALAKCRFKTKVSIYPAGIYTIQKKLAKARGDSGKASSVVDAEQLNGGLKKTFSGLAAVETAITQATPSSLSLPLDSLRRVALVIGNSSYQYLPVLDNPHNDAELIAKTLTKLHFELVGGRALLDLSRANFEETVKAFSLALHGSNLNNNYELSKNKNSHSNRAVVALFYYAGHGLQARGENFLIPIDANPTKDGDLDFQTMNVNMVLRQMEGATSLNMVILDACRNNPFGGRGLRSSGNGLAEIRAPEGTLVAFATQSGNIAQDGPPGDNSPFASALAWGLQQPGLDQFGVFNAVAVKVKKITSGEQQPWMSNSPIEGRFFFVPP